MYEAVEFSEQAPEGQAATTTEIILGTFEDELEAVAAGRAARDAYLQSSDEGYTWWLVREKGARLARWIADSRSDKEFVLDLRTGELTEV